jgi:pyruvate dehydrogenase (quinone)
VEAGLVGDCKRVLQALLALVKHKKDRRFLKQARDGMQEWNKLLEERTSRTDMPMKPQVVAHHLNRYLGDDAIIVSDCGTVTTWAARYIKMRGSMMFSSSGMLATMGNGLPYSVGAAIAYPGRQLATLVKYKLPVKVIIIKNNTLGQIKWEQMVFEGNTEFGCDLYPIDFAKYAEACGAAGFTLEDPKKVDDVLSRAFAHPGPAVVQAVVDPNEPAMPGHVTMKQALNFAEALVRGEKDRWAIIKNQLTERIREVV